MDVLDSAFTCRTGYSINIVDHARCNIVVIIIVSLYLLQASYVIGYKPDMKWWFNVCFHL